MKTTIYELRNTQEKQVVNIGKLCWFYDKYKRIKVERILRTIQNMGDGTIGYVIKTLDNKNYKVKYLDIKKIQ